MQHSLNDQQKREKDFHDQKTLGEKKISSIYEYNITNFVILKLLKKIRHGDLKVLEIGCGNGWFTKKLAERGVEVHAIDLSIGGIKKNKVIKQKEIKDRIHIYNIAAEELSFKNDTFDIIVGNAILHHTDLHKSITEIFRVLKKNGSAYFIEPLGHNPLINYYRKKTPHLRSPDEKPLTFSDINYFKTIFNKVEHEEYGFFVLLAFILRYIIKSRESLIKIINLLHKTDEVFLKFFPFFRKYYWLSLIILKK